MNLTHYVMHNKILKLKSIKLAFILATVLASVLPAGCAIDFSKYGDYQRRWEVTRMFEEPALPADYTYYFAHTASNPKALIGIAPGHTLDNDLWSNFKPERLKRLLDNMQVRDGYYGAHFYGSDILDPNGTRIGIYYSGRDGGPIVMAPGDSVIVYLPSDRGDRRDE